MRVCARVCARASFACPPAMRHAAGMLIHDGKGMVLLGLHREGWTTFSGKMMEGETPYETALRECHEETAYSIDVCDREADRPMLSTSPRGLQFYLYPVRVPFDRSVPGRFRANLARYSHLPECRETRRLAWFHWDRLPRRLRPSFAKDLDAMRAHVYGLRLTQEGGGATRGTEGGAG